MNTPIAPRSSGPGRPKDPEKRAAILCAAQRLFLEKGYEGTSMDAIAAEAGVSKLTVYSHFTDKETLFSTAVRVHCREQLHEPLFENMNDGPLRERLQAIGRTYMEMLLGPEAIRLQRLLNSGTGVSSKMVKAFWSAGPQQAQEGMSGFLQREADAGRLELDDAATAARQFFALIRCDIRARLLCGVDTAPEASEIERHVASAVEMFLRAYGSRREA